VNGSLDRTTRSDARGDDVNVGSPGRPASGDTCLPLGHGCFPLGDTCLPVGDTCLPPGWLGGGGEALGEGRYVPAHRRGEQGLRGQGSTGPAAIIDEAGGMRGRGGQRWVAVVFDEGGRSLHAPLPTARHCPPAP
jgi:hypothetical protein